MAPRFAPGDEEARGTGDYHFSAPTGERESPPEYECLRHPRERADITGWPVWATCGPPRCKTVRGGTSLNRLIRGRE